MTVKLVSLQKKQTEKAQLPIDRCLDQIDDFDEIMVLAKVKREERYVRFTSTLKSTFWWIGVLEAMKRNLMEKSMTTTDQ